MAKNELPGEPHSTGERVRELAVFLVKLAAYLVCLGLFGYAVFWLRRSVH